MKTADFCEIRSCHRRLMSHTQLAAALVPTEASAATTSKKSLNSKQLAATVNAIVQLQLTGLCVAEQTRSREGRKQQGRKRRNAHFGGCFSQ